MNIHKTFTLFLISIVFVCAHLEAFYGNISPGESLRKKKPIHLSHE